MSKLPFVDDFCDRLSNFYVEIFYFRSPEIITKRKIIEIQKKVILESTEEGDRKLDGVLLDQYTLDNILDGWYDWDKEPDSIVFASYMFHGIAYKHPFIQGNKRTALMTATLILGCCGKSLECDDKELYKFVKEVADGKHELPVVIEWIKVHTIEARGYKKLEMILLRLGSEIAEAKSNNDQS
jgi:death-on-curing family protein